ncbi:hypothetical protein [Rhizobium ruizarguesonis]|uniref:hypothetical protein n=1 Tax=Rhizobium ruizarguesonis TaxID=2081791 RepID=UPI00096958C0|nr:hypothetical protein [Rhizobium ruizarguesonis]UED34247.1 hypothetical protein BSO17_24380 [Rhizobium ruizarguesonis]
MRKYSVIAIFAATCLMSLTSCITTGGSTPEDIIAATKRGCQFAPTVTSVLAILNLPGAPAADKIVTAICGAVNKAKEAGFVPPGKEITVEAFGKPVRGKLQN